MKIRIFNAILLISIFTSCESSSNFMIQIENNTNRSLIIESQIQSQQKIKINSSDKYITLFKEHLINKPCEMYFMSDSFIVVIITRIGKIENNDTIYSIKNFKQKSEWTLDCEKSKHHVNAIYNLVIDNNDF